ncbi:gustatory and odorant receptor 24-like isoform X1 [Frankliniella occidentalis]|uniref:Gustatory receptor n=1 Tax=Frankliniella occidentalis TaxID=133901 RepID=A0A6J1RZ22_FRAOC|nr:gustatory and odorant receptor 24-like isoform X1 [Frankliniella occidentalis]
MAGPCEYVLTFKPLWRVLSLYAAWPQRVTKGGRLVRSGCSLRSVFTGLGVCLSCWRSWEALVFHLNFHFQIRDVPTRLLNLQYAVYIISLGIQIGFIRELPGNAAYAARWHDFQPELERVCGRRMRNDSLRKRVKYTAMALCFGWPLAIVVLVTLSSKYSPITFGEILFQAYVTTVFTLASTSWRMHCAFLRNACSMLGDALDEALLREDLDRKEVMRLERTWLKLYYMVNAGLRSITTTTFLDIVILVLNYTIVSFNVLYVIFNGFTILGVFLIFAGLLGLVTLTRICDQAHRINEELGGRPRQALATIRTYGRHRDTVGELDMFRLILRTHPARVVLLGFLPINRAVLGTLLVTMTTYLIVLIQLAVDA